MSIEEKLAQIDNRLFQLRRAVLSEDANDSDRKLARSEYDALLQRRWTLTRVAQYRRQA